MANSGTSKASREDAASTLCSALGVLDASIWRIGIILVGVGLSLRATVKQREHVVNELCGIDEPEPDVVPMRIASALLVLYSLFYFLKLSRGTLQKAEAAEENTAEQSSGTAQARCAAEVDYVGNLLVVSVALARLWLLLRTAESGAEDAEQAEDAGGAAVDSAAEIA